MPLLPTRQTLRSPRATLAWAAGICLFAIGIVGQGSDGGLDAAATPDTPNAVAAALAAED